MLDPFQLQNMRYRWRKWGVFDCNWKVAMEAFCETYHVQTTHPEFNQFGEFRGWARAQGRHSNIGYDAPKGMDENQQAKLRIGAGADARLSTAEMQVYTWENANTNTTRTLVDAALRLVDELPEGTPRDKVLKHWLESARRDDEARGVIWPTVDPAHVGKSGTAWQIFPNFQIGHAVNNMLCYSARPYGYDPDKCIFEAAVYELYPKGEEPGTEWEYCPPTAEAWCRPAAGLLQHGRGAAGHEVAGVQRPEAQSVHGAQRRQPAPQPGEVHGHRRTAHASSSCEKAESRIDHNRDIHGVTVYERILQLFEAEGINTLFGIPDPNFVHMFLDRGEARLAGGRSPPRRVRRLHGRSGVAHDGKARALHRHARARHRQCGRRDHVRARRELAGHVPRRPACAHHRAARAPRPHPVRLAAGAVRAIGEVLRRRSSMRTRPTRSSARRCASRSRGRRVRSTSSIRRT